MTGRRPLVTLTLLLALSSGASCLWPHTKRICVKITNYSAAAFAFEISGPGCSGPTRIQTITVRRDSVEVWRAVGDAEARLQVVYGAAPPGFEAYAPRPLRPGDRISIAARGPGMRGSGSAVLE